MRTSIVISPGPGRPTPQLNGGWLFAVRYLDRHGQSVTLLTWRRRRAERLAAQVRRRGGIAVISTTRVVSWTPLPVPDPEHLEDQL